MLQRCQHSSGRYHWIVWRGASLSVHSLEIVCIGWLLFFFASSKRNFLRRKSSMRQNIDHCLFSLLWLYRNIFRVDEYAPVHRTLAVKHIAEHSLSRLCRLFLSAYGAHTIVKTETTKFLIKFTCVNLPLSSRIYILAC